MKRLLTLVLVLAAAGCLRYEGPREVYQKNRRGDHADLPGYTIDEQKERGRERLPLLEDNRERFPDGVADRPGGIGR